ncbi:hypothetical protein TrLO_g10179 [Triparma laevis f. longispina]|uniref:Chloride channel protein n=1 Tax=Triparma laevis f. longispina TaxID=1714387 RepID=A0A9W7FAZ7_9STRA|nr:hypothetical protein TrLO_g10179 [Triparma laevis f. longispina]
MRNTLDSWGEYAETKQSLSSRGELPPPDTSPTKGTEEENGNAFLRFRSDLEKTSKRISQKRLDALHQDAALSQAEKYGTDINSDEANGGQNRKIRRSRTEAANSASEAGVNHKLIAGSANSQSAPRSSRRKSLVKQDATLEYFRDRRPNKHSGYRRAVTNVQNVFVMRWKTVFLLWLVGASTGCVHTMVTSLEKVILDAKKNFVETVKLNHGLGAGFAVWWILTAAVMLVSLGLTLNISPVAAGSGIPQMKTQLTGATIKGYLSFRTLVAKICGLVCSVGAGMYIGQEGPFVHIASALANCFIYMKGFGEPFKRIRENKPVKLAILEAACAVGVSSTFRSPIGGVLFAIEVTSTYYMVANYWKGFLAAFSASLMSHVIEMIISLFDTDSSDSKGTFEFDPVFRIPYNTTTYTSLEDIYATTSYEIWEIPLFIILGVFMGYCGSFMVRLNAKLSRFKSRIMTECRPATKEIVWTLMAATITSVCYLFGNFATESYHDNILAMISPSDLDTGKWTVPQFILDWDWGDQGVIFPLFLFFLSNLILVSLSLTVAVPCGCFVPLFAGGAAFGRIVGEAVQYWAPTATSTPGGYALVGAAALTAGGTRTVSVAVIAVELTGELEYILPLFLGVFASCIMGSRYSPSIYDSILKARKLPFLPNVNLKPNAVVSDIMSKHVPHLEKQCSTLDMVQVLRQKFEHDIPLVESKATMLLHGTISRQEIEEVVRQFYAEHNLLNVDGDIYMQTTSENADALSPIPRQKLSTVERERKKDLLNRSHDLLHHREIHVQAAPFILQAQTPAEDVHIIFTMLKCNGVFVTSYGMLVGVMNKSDLFAANVDEEDATMDIYTSMRTSPKKGVSKKNLFGSIFSSSGSERSSGLVKGMKLENAVEGGRGGLEEELVGGEGENGSGKV